MEHDQGPSGTGPFTMASEWMHEVVRYHRRRLHRRILGVVSEGNRSVGAVGAP